MTISFFAMPTLATGSRRVARVNKAHRHASPGCLVGEKTAELIESPGMPFVAVFVPNIAVILTHCVRHAILEIWKRQQSKTTQNQKKSHINGIEDFTLSGSRSKKGSAINVGQSTATNGKKNIQIRLVPANRLIEKEIRRKYENIATQSGYEIGWKSLMPLEESALDAVLMTGVCFKLITSMVEEIRSENRLLLLTATTRICFLLQKSTKSYVLTAIKSSGMKRRRGENTARDARHSSRIPVRSSSASALHDTMAFCTNLFAIV